MISLTSDSDLSKIGFIYSPDYLRNRAGIFGTNTGINIMALFIPAVIYPFAKNIEKTVLLRKGAFVGVLYNVIASLSRLGMVLISLLYIIFSLNSLKRFMILIVVIVTLGMAVNQVLESIEVDLVEIILFRFQGYEGNASEKAMDERFKNVFEFLIKDRMTFNLMGGYGAFESFDRISPTIETSLFYNF